jgi:hypothetical protein
VTSFRGMAKTKLSRRERVLAVVTVAVVALVLLYAAAIEPARARWSQLSMRRQTAELALERSQKLASAVDDIEGGFSETFSVGKSIDEAVNSLMEDVRARASGTVRITGVRPTSPSQEHGFQIAKSQVEFEGTLNQTAAFLYHVEKESGGLWLERCQLSPVGKGSNLLRGTAVVCKAAAQAAPEDVEP